MKQLFDFIPLIAFFTTYKMTPSVLDIGGYSFTLGGPFSATFILMLSSTIVYAGFFLKERRLEKSQIFTLIATLFFGGMTLLFHSESFLKWKAPIVNWVFACAFLISMYVGDKMIIQRMLGEMFTAPYVVWKRLNLAWIGFFLVMGFMNLYVAFTFHDIWVDFKVFGSLIATVVFVIAQVVYLLNSKQVNANIQMKK